MHVNSKTIASSIVWVLVLAAVLNMVWPGIPDMSKVFDSVMGRYPALWPILALVLLILAPRSARVKELPKGPRNF